MSQARLQITKAGVTGYLLIGIGRDHNWRLESPVSWVNGTYGTWSRFTNSTKFRSWTYIELADGTGASVMTLREFPYQFHDRFKGNLIDRGAFFQTPGDDFDVLVVSAPPAMKKFRIRETWSGTLSVVVIQGEMCGFEILDPTTNQSQTYLYRGVGISFGIPSEKLPSTLPGASNSGPWNEFEAPGWMTVKDFSGDARFTTIYNVGLGTSSSLNVFDFAGNVDGNPAFLVHIERFSTGHTLSLPSTGFSSGSMSFPEVPSDAPAKRGLQKGGI